MYLQSQLVSKYERTIAHAIHLNFLFNFFHIQIFHMHRKDSYILNKKFGLFIYLYYLDCFSCSILHQQSAYLTHTTDKHTCLHANFPIYQMSFVLIYFAQ